MYPTRKLTEDGGKDHQRDDWEDRAKEYREWHYRELSRKCYAWDVDLIEWREKDGRLVPKAVCELTRMDFALYGETLARYQAAILERMNGRDAQATTARMVANSLGVGLYIVLFTRDLEHFYVYNVTGREGWAHLNEVQWRQKLEAL
jgi:hypothetical protein